MAADALLSTLTRFHRDVVVPDIERIIDSRITGAIAPLREEMLANFDAVFKSLDRLETEYQSLNAAVRRLEERLAAVEQRLAAVEQKIERLALRSELVELKERVHVLEHRIAELETQL
jgi:predicted  nucleic acid-binding Zn-ribbon protein